MRPAPLANSVACVEEIPGKAIVIVDDEMSFTDLLGRMLGDHFKCPIVTFSNPLTLIQSLPRLNVGVLVTDYYMPHLNGLDLIRKAGEIMPLTPCLLITGHSFEHDDTSANLANFKDILPKPFRWQQLARLIEKHWPGETPAPLCAGVVSLHR